MLVAILLTVGAVLLVGAALVQSRRTGEVDVAVMFSSAGRADVVDGVTSSDSGSSARPSTTVEQMPTPEQLARADEELRQEFASGWVRYADVPATAGDVVPATAFVPTMPIGNPYDGRPRDRREVYDAPNGRVIGFQYVQLGYVPVEKAGAFDARAARVARYGCDVVLDEVCRNTVLGGRLDAQRATR